MCDDVFEEDEGLMVPEENEWNKLERSMKVDGFRDGVSKGEEGRLQVGFNAGYREAIKTAFNLAKLRGKINAVLGRNLKDEGLVTTELHAKVEDLLGDVLTLESNLLKYQTQELIPESDNCDKGAACCGGDGKCKQESTTQQPTAEGSQIKDGLEIFKERTRTFDLQFLELIRGSNVEHIFCTQRGT